MTVLFSCLILFNPSKGNLILIVVIASYLMQILIYKALHYGVHKFINLQQYFYVDVVNNDPTPGNKLQFVRY